MIQKLISKIKGGNYQITSSYTKVEWCVIINERAWQILRGIWSKLFLTRLKGLFFKGKNVSIKHRRLFSSGKNLILGNGVTINALSENGIRLGENVTIAQNCTLICTGIIADKGTGIRIGNNTGINAYCYLGGQGGITIGDDVIVGPYVKIFSENHNFSEGDLAIRKQGVSRKGVSIGNDCWIGANTAILDGVELKDRTVVAAGSVVTKSFEGNVLLGGIPAKVLKKI